MTVLAGLLAAVLPLPLCAPAQEEGSAALREDAAFARALTLQLGFDNLSEIQLDRSLSKAKDNDRAFLLLARCDVRKEAAQRAIEVPARLEGFSRAVDAYTEFLAADPDAELAFAGRTSLAEVAYLYGSSLKLALDAGVIPAERQADERKNAEKVFDRALQSLNTLIEEYGKLDADQKDELRQQVYFPSLYYRALVYFYWGLLYPAGSVDRKENCRRARQQLEDFTLEVGETSRAGFMGYNALAEVYAAESDFEAAASYFQHVIDSAVPSDPNVEIPQAELEGRRVVVQDAYLGLVSMYLKQDRVQDVIAKGETFQAWEEGEGVVLSDSGYRVLLRYADALNRSGRYDDALKISERVARMNERSVLRLEANAVARDILEKLPADAAIDLAVLYDAAYGAFAQKEYAEAVRGFQRVLSRLPGSSKANEFGGQTYYYLGRTWDAMDRKLEAAVCYQLACELFPDDQDYGMRSAQGWQRLAEQFYSAAREDPVLARFRDEANAALGQFGGGNVDLALWQGAQSDFNAAREAARKARDQAADSPEARAALAAFDKALRSFSGFQKGSRYFERAWIMRGRCEYSKIAWDAAAADRAFKIFNDYLEDHIVNLENNPADPAGRKTRAEMTAEAAYWRAQCRFRQGETRRDGAYPEFLRLSADYATQYPEQGDFVGGTFFTRVLAHLALQDVDAAEAEFQKLAAAKLDPKWVDNTAYQIYKHYQARLEVETAADQKPALARKAVEYLHASNAAAAQPSWKNLYAEARLQLLLGNSVEASRILESVLRTEATGRSEADQFLLQIALVEAYLAQDNTGAAAPIIEKLLEDPRRQKDLDVLDASLRILVGYPVLRDGRLIEVPGSASSVDEFKKADETLSKLLVTVEAQATQAGASKYELAGFWRLKLMQAYLYYRWGQVDGALRGKHKTFVNSLRSLTDLGAQVMGTDFRTLMEKVEAL
ncbi:MAG: hypothetical protein EYC70_14575 [Planctomycetota bacterium]|nr:MAG: hypothetical protein EYC70_14575 [Planctomycetota bacterium]